MCLVWFVLRHCKFAQNKHITRKKKKRPLHIYNFIRNEKIKSIIKYLIEMGNVYDTYLLYYNIFAA